MGIHIGMYFWGREDFDNWAGIPFFGFGDKMVEWSRGHFPEYISSNDRGAFGFYCNEDAMFHPGKGLLALKISGVEGVVMNDVQIENIQDETPLGSDLCGVMDQPKHGQYHFAQQLPYQVGFSMNMVMGITIDFSDVQMTNTRINGLYSHTGLVYGMAGWFESNIKVNGDLDIKSLHAGVDVDDDTFNYMDLPNKAPEACAIRLFDSHDFQLTIDWDEELTNTQSCIKGAVGCLGHDDQFTFHGQILDDEMSCSMDTPFTMAPATFGELLETDSSLIPKPKAPPPPSADHEITRVAWFRRNFEKLFQSKSETTVQTSNVSLDTAFLDNFMIGMIVIALFIIGWFAVKMVYLSKKRKAKAAVRNLSISEISPLIGLHG